MSAPAMVQIEATELARLRAIEKAAEAVAKELTIETLRNLKSSVNKQFPPPVCGG